MRELLTIGIGGFVGAIARYLMAGFIHKALNNSSFPFGTLVVNVLGCLIIGAIVALMEERQVLLGSGRLFLLIGVLGSFTTFSTLGYETFEYLRNGELFYGACNALFNLCFGLIAVFIGSMVIKLIFN